jgi:hypothetical protein
MVYGNRLPYAIFYHTFSGLSIPYLGGFYRLAPVIRLRYSLRRNGKAWLNIAAYEDEIKDLLNIPENKKVIIGIALGYPDWDNAVTRYKSPRESLDKFVRWME